MNRRPQTERSKTLGSFRLFQDADFLQRAQILDDQLQRNGPVFCGYCVANLLRIALAVSKVEHFVGVLLAAAPETLVAEDFRRGDPGRRGAIVDVVGTKHAHRSSWYRFARENQESIAAWIGVLGRARKRIGWQEVMVDNRPLDFRPA